VPGWASRATSFRRKGEARPVFSAVTFGNGCSGTTRLGLALGRISHRGSRSLQCGVAFASSSLDVSSLSSTPHPSPTERLAQCQRLHAESLAQPERFWLREAQALDWVRAPTAAFEGEFASGDVSWFGDGLLNVTTSCVDRHAASFPERPALVWLRAEGDVETLSYRALRQQMCRMANVLLAYGVRPQDRVAVYLPQGVPWVVALLACARIGAVHLNVPVRADSDWLRRALRVARVKLLVTANEADLGQTRIPLWERADAALNGLGRVEGVLVHWRTQARVPLAYARDHDLDRALGLARPTCVPTLLSGEEALLLATAANDEGPRPVVQSAAGYVLQAMLAQREVLGVGPGERLLCHTEVGDASVDVLYGALALGATVVLDELSDGVERLDALGVTHFLGPPGDIVKATAGRGQRPLLVSSSGGAEADVEAIWSSEGGGMLLARWPGLGSTALFGIDEALLDARGHPVAPLAEGELWTRSSWPAQPRTLEGDHARFVDQRLRRVPGLYRTGERCRRLKDGCLVWTGRTVEPALVALATPDDAPLQFGPFGLA
jgi:acetyl-CoA synthetase